MAERRVSVSNSFTESEVKILDFIFSTLQRGGDPRMITRNKSFANLSAKIIRMKQRMDDAKKKREAAEVKLEEIKLEECPHHCDKGWIHHQHPTKPQGVIMNSSPCPIHPPKDAPGVTSYEIKVEEPVEP
jgi:hypothetical protein